MGFLAPENLSWGCPASGIYQGVGKQSETPARDIFGGVYKAQTLAGGEASGTGRGEGATQGQFSPRAEPERPGFWARDSSRRVWNQRGSGSGGRGAVGRSLFSARPHGELWAADGIMEPFSLIPLSVGHWLWATAGVRRGKA